MGGWVRFSLLFGCYQGETTNIRAQRAIGGMAYRSCSGTISSTITPSRVAVLRWI